VVYFYLAYYCVFIVLYLPTLGFQDSLHSILLQLLDVYYVRVWTAVPTSCKRSLPQFVECLSVPVYIYLYFEGTMRGGGELVRSSPGTVVKTKKEHHFKGYGLRHLNMCSWCNEAHTSTV
jgi:hypothetical protein